MQQKKISSFQVKQFHYWGHVGVGIKCRKNFIKTRRKINKLSSFANAMQPKQLQSIYLNTLRALKVEYCKIIKYESNSSKFISIVRSRSREVWACKFSLKVINASHHQQTVWSFELKNIHSQKPLDRITINFVTLLNHRVYRTIRTQSTEKIFFFHSWSINSKE